MAKPIEVTDSTFQAQVMESALPVVVDFWATWCPPCRMIAPFLEQIADEYEGKALVCKVDVDKNQALSQRFSVRSIPTILFVKGGEVRDQVVGALPKDQIIARLNALI
jgi:thioredoxin 1